MNQQRGEERDLPHLDAAPAIPEYSGPPLKHTLSKPVPFLSKDVEKYETLSPLSWHTFVTRCYLMIFFSEFVRGIGKAPPEIDSRTSRKLLRKSVAAVCAHAGFDGPYEYFQPSSDFEVSLVWTEINRAAKYFLPVCNESILETLTDVTHEYLLQFTKLMRHARDEEAMRGTTGFPVCILASYEVIQTCIVHLKFAHFDGSS